MATKSLTITEEAYERLRAHKRGDESFTDTILRLTNAETDVLKGFGAFEDADGFRESVETARENIDDGFRTRRSKRTEQRDL
ncbi:antitoxin VapB family protein [Natronorubrum halophilum]|uniref:antitoxin VapB family protein n=1 Tax=Natronorubrum halophilum TaxID=1702106 RepID=UPI0010C19BBD|nr:antitoxin VapB family protein [Natronorubrum halophilum]